MTTTLTVGKRGTIVIPKQIRTECHMDEGARIDVSVESGTVVLAPSVQTRTRLDDNLDRMRATLTGRGVTLEAAMQTLRQAKQDAERAHGDE